nr:MAG TPA: KilA protein [Caudoviricetes sp.]
MITNQIMKRPLADFTVEQRTKDGYFCLTGLLNNWNLKMGTKKELKDYFENKATQEFVKALADEENLHGDKSPYVKSKARLDRGGGTWGHPLLFIDFAMWLNPHFKVKVLKFVSDQMLTYRNEAGDAYKQLSSAMSKICTPHQMKRYMPILGKGINYIVAGHHEHQLRNEYGTEEKQKECFELEKQVAMLVNEGFLKTPEDVANYLRRKFQNKYF